MTDNLPRIQKPSPPASYVAFRCNSKIFDDYLKRACHKVFGLRAEGSNKAIKEARLTEHSGIVHYVDSPLSHDVAEMRAQEYERIFTRCVNDGFLNDENFKNTLF